MHIPYGNKRTVLEELGVLIERHIKKRAVGTFTLPGLLRIIRVRRPPRKARTMVSPRTGEEITVPAKPVSTAVKVRPLAGVKRMVEQMLPSVGPGRRAQVVSARTANPVPAAHLRSSRYPSLVVRHLGCTPIGAISY